MNKQEPHEGVIYKMHEEMNAKIADAINHFERISGMKVQSIEFVYPPLINSGASPLYIKTTVANTLPL